MCHYISDPTSYWHTGDRKTTRSYSHAENHMKFERSTDSRVKYKDSPSMGVFEYKSLLDNLDDIEALNPIDATIHAAWDTYWDTNYLSDYPYNKGLYNHHWMNVLDQKKVNSIKVWERAKKSIHIAMVYSAKAIKWTIGDHLKKSGDFEANARKVEWNKINRTPRSLFSSKYSFRKMVSSLRNFK